MKYACCVAFQNNIDRRRLEKSLFFVGGLIMKTHGFYIMKEEFNDLVRSVGGVYDYLNGNKRPIYCCIKDSRVDGLYWAIPTSDLSHRSAEQLERYNRFLSLPDRDLRSCYYHIGRTTKEALFKISSCFPVTEKYIDHEFTTSGTHVVLRRAETVNEIERKLKRILAFESRKPNYFPQRITDLKLALIKELE